MTLAVPQNLRFDITPSTNPKDGAVLVSLTKADMRPGSGVRVEHNGTGSGRIVLSAKHPAATAANLTKYNYVRAYDVDVSSTLPFAGFFLVEGDFKAITENESEDRDITFEGPGSLIYLNRGVMANESYLTSPFIGQDPFDDLWRLYAAGTGNAPGQMIWRVVRELVEAGRPQSPVPDLTINFDAADPAIPDMGLDSAGVPWAGYSIDATARVKEKVLRVIMRLAELGVILDMKPDFTFSAYQTWGRSLVGTTFGTSKVRFVRGVNIASPGNRALRGGVEVSHLLAGMNDVYEWATEPTATIVIEEGMDVESTDPVALVKAGDEDLAKRLRASDSVKLKVAYGNDAANGFYRPHRPEVLAANAAAYWVGDTVTLDSGTGAFDWVNAPRLVASINWELGDAGWDPVVVEFGASYLGLAERPQMALGGTPFAEDPFFVDDASTAAINEMRMRDYGAIGFYRGIHAARGDVSGSDADASLDLVAVPGVSANAQLFATDDGGTAFSIIDVAGDGEISIQSTDLVQIEENSVDGDSMLRLDDGKIYSFADFGVVDPVLSADPAGGDSEIGQRYYNDVSNTGRWYNGTIWQDLGTGGGGGTTPGAAVISYAEANTPGSTGGTPNVLTRIPFDTLYDVTQATIGSFAAALGLTYNGSDEFSADEDGVWIVYISVDLVAAPGSSGRVVLTIPNLGYNPQFEIAPSGNPTSWQAERIVVMETGSVFALQQESAGASVSQITYALLDIVRVASVIS